MMIKNKNISSEYLNEKINNKRIKELVVCGCTIYCGNGPIVIHPECSCRFIENNILLNDCLPEIIYRKR